MPRIRLLTVIPGLTVGGAEKQLVGLLTRLDRSLFDLAVCHYSPSENSLAGELEHAGIQTIFFDKFSMPVWRFFGRLRAAVRDFNPDIVHTWLYSANFWGRWAAVTCGVKRIVASDRVEIVQPHLLDRISERLLAPNTTRLGNSLAVARSLERWFDIPLDQSRVIYNGVVMPGEDAGMCRRSVRDELGLASDARIVMMVARQNPQKNYPMFIRAAARLCRRRPDLHFVGVGRADQMDELQALIDREGVTGRVHLVGQQNDVNRWLLAADVFCLATWFEGFPNSILEAMAAGLPVVTTAFPGVEELIASPDLGEVVPLDDDAAMADRVQQLIDDPEHRPRLSGAGRELVRRRFTWDAVVEKMERLYCELAARDYPGAADTSS